MRRQTRQTHLYRGNEQGFSLIELMIVVSIIAILIVIGNVAYQSAQRTANETAAIRNLIAISTEQRNFYRLRNEYGTFQQLIDEGLDSRFAPQSGDANAVDNGYIFRMETTPKSGSQPATFKINADPQQATGLTATGRRFFYIGSDSSNVHVNLEQPASAEDPTIRQ